MAGIVYFSHIKILHRVLSLTRISLQLHYGCALSNCFLFLRALGSVLSMDGHQCSTSIVSIMFCKQQKGNWERGYMVIKYMQQFIDFIQHDLVN
ncbi:hypothetical protein HanPI659440_Chr10g0396391 [Helianthus annuus]|nr:hypothetical protein HanPI659440_Chr10g0396391 [Helianthus annuus]